jgi:hypothetical protein
MSQLICKACQHNNIIDAPVQPSDQPVQDWFCKKCDAKLFSVSFRKPAHADTAPLACPHCRHGAKLTFNSQDSSRKFASWKCNSCGRELVKLEVKNKKRDSFQTAAKSKKDDYKKRVDDILISKHGYKRNNDGTVTAQAPKGQPNDRIQMFLSKYWRLIGLVAIVALIWVSVSDNTSTSYPRNTVPAISSTKTQNVYRGTKIAKQEFYKRTKSERLRVQKFLQNNFGYNSILDGLWGPKTANSFVRAADKYAKNQSLYSATNVNRVFKTALENQKSTPRAQVVSKRQNEAKPGEQIGKAIETILMLGAAKAILGDRSNGRTKTIIPRIQNSNPSYSYGNNGNTIYHPGGNSKFSYGSNGSMYYNPGNCPVKPCN